MYIQQCGLWVHPSWLEYRVNYIYAWGFGVWECVIQTPHLIHDPPLAVSYVGVALVLLQLSRWILRFLR